MRKLKLESLRVDSFTTSPGGTGGRGTIAAHEAALGRFSATCPVSWGGTCWITCWDSCYCETEYEC